MKLQGTLKPLWVFNLINWLSQEFGKKITYILFSGVREEVKGNKKINKKQKRKGAGPFVQVLGYGLNEHAAKRAVSGEYERPVLWTLYSHPDVLSS